MKILIWPGHHDCLDAAIKFLTHGQGSHAAFLRADDQRIHEAFWPRVRTRPMTPEDRQLTEVYELEGVSAEQHNAFEQLFDRHDAENIRYSIPDLFRFALNLPSRDEHHTYCSRYCLYCLKTILPRSLMPLIRIPNGDWASPRDLRMSPRLKLMKNYFHQPTTAFGRQLISTHSHPYENPA